MGTDLAEGGYLNGQVYDFDLFDLQLLTAFNMGGRDQPAP